MRRSAAAVTDPSGVSAQLFLSLAEGLKLPFEQIARWAELVSLNGQESEHLADIQWQADTSLRLLDSYMLALRLSLEPDEQFEVEPVCVSAVLHEACQQLSASAEQYGVELELHLGARYAPIMAHRQALKSALVSLGQSLIEAVPATSARQLHLQVAAHRTRYGIVAGMYFDAEELTPEVLRQAHGLHGHARQPLVSISPGSATGVFVAGAILAAMSSRLRIGRFQKQPGFAVTLTPSSQLSFV